MKAKLLNVTIKNCVVKNGENKGKKFDMLDYTVEIVNDKGDVKTRKGSMSVEYARKYFAYCGVKTSDVVGGTVEVVLAKRRYEIDGEERTTEYVKFLNCVDENGKAIIMRKEEEKEINF